jgi:hypothetical protein
MENFNYIELIFTVYISFMNIITEIKNLVRL